MLKNHHGWSMLIPGHKPSQTESPGRRHDMIKIPIHDLHDAETLESQCMAKIRGGMFGAVFNAWARDSASSDGSANPSPGTSDITFVKRMDSAPSSLF
jgi:hypothetical protein